MDASPLAAAQELVFLAAALAVALLLIFQLKLSQRFRTLDLEVQRLKRAHRDGTLDARSRLEEASKALESLEESVTPKLEALEPHLADAGARLDELEERVTALVPALEAAGQRETEASEVLADARARLEQAEEVARTVGERFGVIEEGVRDARDRLTQSERGLDHLRTAIDERIEEIDQRIRTLQATPSAAPKHPAREALGFPERRPGRSGADAGEAEDDEAAEPGDEATEPADEEAEHVEPGMRMVLLLVIGLAVFAAVMHWAGFGR